MSKTTLIILFGIIAVGFALGGLLGLADRPPQPDQPNLATPARDRSFHD